jgi:hypothetical protein
MSLFSAIVKTVVNVAVLPVAVAVDVVTLGGVVTDKPSATLTQIEKIKEESED